MRPVLAVVAAGGIALGAVVAGCGGDDGEDPQGTDLTAVYCPMAPTGMRVAGDRQWEPAENAFDIAELVGMSLSDARNKASEHGCEIIVAFEDGEGIPVPIETDPTRIYVYVEQGRVTHIEGLGGGL